MATDSGGPVGSHVLMLRDGRVTAAGPIESTLTAESLSLTFALAVTLQGSDGRWAVRAALPPAAGDQSGTGRTPARRDSMSETW